MTVNRVTSKSRPRIPGEDRPRPWSTGDPEPEHNVTELRQAWILTREPMSLRSKDEVHTRLLWTVPEVVKALEASPRSTVQEVWIKVGERVMVEQPAPVLVPWVSPDVEAEPEPVEIGSITNFDDDENPFG